jgi:hypothetical protein
MIRWLYDHHGCPETIPPFAFDTACGRPAYWRPPENAPYQSRAMKRVFARPEYGASRPDLVALRSFLVSRATQIIRLCWIDLVPLLRSCAGTRSG